MKRHITCPKVFRSLWVTLGHLVVIGDAKLKSNKRNQLSVKKKHITCHKVRFGKEVKFWALVLMGQLRSFRGRGHLVTQNSNLISAIDYENDILNAPK